MTDIEKVNQAKAIKEMQENMPAMLAGLEISARYTRVKFLELRKQGFSEEQALTLCKT